MNEVVRCLLSAADWNRGLDMSDNRFRPTVVQGIVVVGSVVVLSFFWNLLLEYLKRDNPDLQTTVLTRMVPISLVAFVYATWFAFKQKKAKGG